MSAFADRSIDATGGMTFSALGASSSETNASASAAGAKGEKANAGDPDSPDKLTTAETSGSNVNQQADKQLAAANAASTKSADGKTSGKTATPEAGTSDKDASNSTSMSCAAAISINLPTTSSTARLMGANTFKSLNGPIVLRTGANTDSTARADASATTSTVSIAAAVAVNDVHMTNIVAVMPDTALSSNVLSKGLSLEASMTPVGASKDATHTMLTLATSGEGGGTYGVAGSVAIALGNFDTQAVLRGGSNIDAGGEDVSLAAVSRVDSTSKALAKKGAGARSASVLRSR